MHAAATSKVENSAQGSSCKLKFVHALAKEHLECRRAEFTHPLRRSEREREKEGGREIDGVRACLIFIFCACTLFKSSPFREREKDKREREMLF